MKHTTRITLMLIGIFILSQIIGLAVLSSYYSEKPTGELVYKELPLEIERPDVESKMVLPFIVIGILVGTAIMLIFIKTRNILLTKIWFCLAIFLGLTFAFSAFIPQNYAIAIGLIIAVWKVFFPNIIISNIGEIFVYGGIAALFDEMLTIPIAAGLLIVIAIYDAIAVWKIKHMITMARFQTDNKIFAGAMIPYEMHKKKEDILLAPVPLKSHGVRTAILGGGDMAFPLFFAGAVMKSYNVWYALIPVIFSAIALTMLFFFAKKDRFYPAIPFLTAGCFLGYGIVWVLSLI
jgi:presenilin-like A22 family membrane protease